MGGGRGESCGEMEGWEGDGRGINDGRIGAQGMAVESGKRMNGGIWWDLVGDGQGS